MTHDLEAFLGLISYEDWVAQGEAPAGGGGFQVAHHPPGGTGDRTLWNAPPVHLLLVTVPGPESLFHQLRSPMGFGSKPESRGRPVSLFSMFANTQPRA